MRTALTLTMCIALLVGCQSDTTYTDDMAEQHADDTAEASGMTHVEGTEVDTEAVVYGTVDGEEVTGFLATPLGDATDLPGVIVIHEWWGLNANIEAMARAFAARGYRALAVDLYGGEMADDPAGARSLMQAAMGDIPVARQNLTAAHTYLTNAGSSKVGSVGWCFGGHMSLQTGLALPNDLDAMVIYYGNVPNDEALLAPLQMPILGLFGEADGGIPVSSARAFETALVNLDKEAEIVIYEGAGHAFANPSGQNYQEAAATDSWDRTLAFFEQHLD
ncbi:MAG: dienelactone hydrolase family protein [Rhodothermales bacterium]